MKPGLFPVKGIDSIQKHHMKMDIQVEASSETLDKGDRACLGSVLLLQTGFFDKISGNSSLDQVENMAHKLRVFGKEKAKRKGKLKTHCLRGFRGKTSSTR